MIFTNLQSSYLIKPNLSARRKRRWTGFQTPLLSIQRAHPRILSRSLVALTLWSSLVGSIQYLATPSHNHGQPPTAASASRASFSLLKPTANPTHAVAAHALPSGPSGLLLPPGTMAPDRTYPNSYSRGQCTWYVAGRRQIPDRWGNASAWYYHAVASDWSVGQAPAIAAIAWTPTGAFGHVALVEQISADASQVYISEMNYRGVGIKTYRWVQARSFKYIY